MSHGLGKTQRAILAELRKLHGDCYQNLIYQWLTRDYHKASIARAIKSLEGGGCIVREGKGKYKRLILTDAGQLALIESRSRLI